MHNTNSTLIRCFLTGLFPLLMLTLPTSCQKENPIVSKEPQLAASAELVGPQEAEGSEEAVPEEAEGSEETAPEEAEGSEEAVPEEAEGSEEAVPEEAEGSEETAPEEVEGSEETAPEEVEGSEETAPEEVEGSEETAPEEAEGSEETAPEEVEGTEETAPEEAEGTEETVPEEAEGSEEAVPEEAEGSEEAVPEEAEGSEETAPEEAEGSEETAPEEAEGSEETAPEEVEGTEEVAPEEAEGTEEAVPEEAEGSEETVPEEEEEPLEDDAATESGDYDEKPVQVSKPSVTDITRNSARIEWIRAGRAEDYIVLRRAIYADNPESGLSPVHTTSGLSYDDTDLVPDTEYIYHIVARNNVGEAKRSPHLKFRTLAEPVGTVVSAELVGTEEPDEPEGSEVEFIPEEEEEEPITADAAHVEGEPLTGTCEDYDLEQYGHPEFLEHEPKGTFPIRKRYSNRRRGGNYNENPTNNNVTWTEPWEPTTPWAYSESAPPGFAGLDPSRCSKATSYSRFIRDADDFRWIETEAWLCQASLCVLEQIAEQEKDNYCRQPGEICLHPDLNIKDGRPPGGHRSWTEYYEYCRRPGVNCHAEYEDD